MSILPPLIIVAATAAVFLAGALVLRLEQPSRKRTKRVAFFGGQGAAYLLLGHFFFADPSLGLAVALLGVLVWFSAVIACVGGIMLNLHRDDYSGLKRPLLANILVAPILFFFLVTIGGNV